MVIHTSKESSPHSWSCLSLGLVISKLLHIESKILFFTKLQIFCINSACVIFGTDADFVWSCMTETGAGASKHVLVEILIRWENRLPQYSEILCITCRPLRHKRLKFSPIIMNCFLTHFHFVSVHCIFPRVEYIWEAVIWGFESERIMFVG